MKQLGCILLAMASSYSCADIRLSAGLGGGNVEFENAGTFQSTDATSDNFALALSLAYETEQQLVFAMGLDVLTNLSVFGFEDGVHFKTVDAGMAYRFSYKQFFFEPSLAYSKWRLRLQEAAFGHNEPKQKFDDSGYDPSVKLTAGLRLGDHFDLAISYKYMEYDYGDVQSTLLGVGVRF